MNPLLLTFYNFLGVALLHLAVAYFSSKLPLQWFAKEFFWSKIQSWEQKGELWNKLFKIRSWKKKLPDAAPLFKGGFSKSKLQSRNKEYLEHFLWETRRAEAVHWLVLFCSPVFYTFNPPWAGTVLVLYFIIGNLPCILAQRYNRPYLIRLIQK